MFNVLKSDPEPREISSVVNNIMDGKTNNTGSVTLSASTTTTVVTDRRTSDGSSINFMPTTANAATEITTMYVSSKDPRNGTFTITHANNAQTDRDFTYSITG